MHTATLRRLNHDVKMILVNVLHVFILTGVSRWLFDQIETPLTKFKHFACCRLCSFELASFVSSLHMTSSSLIVILCLRLTLEQT